MTSAGTIPRVLAGFRRVAVVGMSKNPEKEAHQVPMYLRQHGFEIIPVNPTATEIAGLKSYPSLSAVPENYDIVEIFRPSEDVPPIVDEAIRAGKAKVIWMQVGIENEGAAKRAEAAGLVVVQDRCMRTEHRKLAP